MTATETLTYRGIEITKENWLFALRHMREDDHDTYSDLYLSVELQFSGGPGTIRANRALLTVPVSVRSKIDSEASIRTNTTGGTWAGNIESVIRLWRAGNFDFPMTRRNKEMLAREAENKRQGKTYWIEQI
jgi:hypothetical protein